jgi:hypothetical protein
VTNQPVVQVRGAKELRKTLKAAGDSLADLKDVHQAVGNMVVSVARGLAPVQTGALAGSIRATRLATGVGLRAGSGSIRYAGPIHWGWPAHNIAANPFLMNAAQTTETEWVGLYEAELNRILDRVEGDT